MMLPVLGWYCSVDVDVNGWWMGGYYKISLPYSLSYHISPYITPHLNWSAYVEAKHGMYTGKLRTT